MLFSKVWEAPFARAAGGERSCVHSRKHCRKPLSSSRYWLSHPIQALDVNQLGLFLFPLPFHNILQVLTLISPSFQLSLLFYWLSLAHVKQTWNPMRNWGYILTLMHYLSFTFSFMQKSLCIEMGRLLSFHPTISWWEEKRGEMCAVQSGLSCSVKQDFIWQMSGTKSSHTNTKYADVSLSQPHSHISHTATRISVRIIFKSTLFPKSNQLTPTMHAAPTSALVERLGCMVESLGDGWMAPFPIWSLVCLG